MAAKKHKRIASRRHEHVIDNPILSFIFCAFCAFLRPLPPENSILEFAEDAIELLGNPREHLKESGIEMTG
jgi:hypothetical protein